MYVIEQNVDIPAGREIVLKLPEAVPVGNTTVTVSIGMQAQPRKITAPVLNYRDAQAAIALASGKTHEGKSFIKYAGCLKDSPLFKGDSVEIQKKMRGEWN